MAGVVSAGQRLLIHAPCHPVRAPHPAHATNKQYPMFSMFCHSRRIVVIRADLLRTSVICGCAVLYATIRCYFGFLLARLGLRLLGQGFPRSPKVLVWLPVWTVFFYFSISLLIILGFLCIFIRLASAYV